MKLEVQTEEEEKKQFIVYLLKSSCKDNNRTYLGITNNSKRRIRQHNGEIKGGAKYTHAFRGEGEWIYHLKVSNLTKSEALSIERTAKNKRKSSRGVTPMQKRLSVLMPILDKYPESLCEYIHT